MLEKTTRWIYSMNYRKSFYFNHRDLVYHGIQNCTLQFADQGHAAYRTDCVEAETIFCTPG